MKKTLSILIASIILIMSVFSVNALDAATESDAVPSTTKTSQLIYEMINSKSYSVTIKNIKNTFTEITDMPFNLKVEKTTFYFYEDVEAIDLNLGILNVRLICHKDSTVGYSPNMPFWYIQTDEILYRNPTIFAGAIMLEMGGYNLFESTTLTTYEETFEEKIYYVEEYLTSSGISKFYYSGDELRYVKSIKDSTEQICSVDIDFEVDEEVFEIPKFAFLDLSFIFKVVSLF